MSLAPSPPAEAILIRRARQAAGLTAEAAAAQARATGGKISATYWRNVENGYGGRRGQRVPMRASDETLALMAATIPGVTPAQLEDAGRPEAAAVLRITAARPPAGSDEAAVWAIVLRHPPGTPGEILFPGAPYAKYWDALAREGAVLEELVPAIAWWMRHPAPATGHVEHRAAS